MAQTDKKLLNSLVYETTLQIPAGKVATYGQIAKIIGLPNHARHVGFALTELDLNGEIAWWRVINAKGETYSKHNGESSNQRQRLESEGIIFNKNGKVNLKKYQWVN